MRLEPPRPPQGQEQPTEGPPSIAAAGLINSICWQGDASSTAQVPLCLYSCEHKKMHGMQCSCAAVIWIANAGPLATSPV